MDPSLIALSHIAVGVSNKDAAASPHSAPEPPGATPAVTRWAGDGDRATELPKEQLNWPLRAHICRDREGGCHLLLRWYFSHICGFYAHDCLKQRVAKGA